MPSLGTSELSGKGINETGHPRASSDAALALGRGIFWTRFLEPSRPRYPDVRLIQGRSLEYTRASILPNDTEDPCSLLSSGGCASTAGIDSSRLQPHVQLQLEKDGPPDCGDSQGV